ncbi:HAD-IC family P-type ATPase [Fructilactobacillus sp. Tb1]|uniref:HAD-IC family P-type ATPase n=1 Tax=Fructilactobacillus sp. Tb1 TaxID=3422304 RepID=UPI003D299EE8
MPQKEKPSPSCSNYYHQTETEIIKEFDTNASHGLSTSAVKSRLKQDGYNELDSKVTPKWLIFIQQFNNIIIYILILAAILTLLMRHYSDSIVITIVIIINAVIGFGQEVKASNALEKIKNLLSTEANVYRNGQRQQISARDLVVGDVVYLEAGDNVPADLRLIDVDSLRIQESSLTGESDSVAKTIAPLAPDTPLAEQTNMAFASTGVTNGSGLGIVVATGEHTEIGKISTSVQDIKRQKSPLTRELDQLGTGISWFIIISSVVLFIFGLVLNIYSLPVLTMAIITMIVGSMPEGLPAATSIILAAGAQKLTKEHAIIKTLPAAETLGAIDIIATDKTGTLTKNEMMIQDIIIKDRHYQVSGNGYNPEGAITLDGQPVNPDADLQKLLFMGFEANDALIFQEDGAWTINGEPTDGAFITAYYKAFGVTEPDASEIDRIPFDSDYRYIAKLVKMPNNDHLTAIKGAPDTLFRLAKQYDSNFDASALESQVSKFANTGKRVIAVGYVPEAADCVEITTDSIENNGIIFLGLVAITDPPRPEVIQTIKEMRTAGIKVKMITGDAVETASAIGRQLGLSENIQTMTGKEVNALSLDELAALVENYDVFARTTPFDKLKIVEAYQKNGNVTAMVGDGVNDAPALKKADIGIAMGVKGTDVAKESADVILADDDFSTIETAIAQGRRLYDNIKKTILFLLPTSFAEGLIVFISILLQQPMPLTPTQLLWINMVSAVTIQLAFIFEPAEPGLMQRPPRNKYQKLMTRHDVCQMMYVSLIIAGMALIIFEIAEAHSVPFAIASTMAVNIIIFGKIFYLFNIRTSAFALSKKVIFSNPMAYVSIIAMILLQLFFTYNLFMNGVFSTAGLSLHDWLIVIVSSLPVLIVAEINKAIRKKLKLPVL